mmetsp:Transcript_21377/g.66269  ORF Transcript_21377/g.66269 Transcript_21377/m.66269 type:complete len:219 (+) Transcript_21377:777-1433(+)
MPPRKAPRLDEKPIDCAAPENTASTSSDSATKTSSPALVFLTSLYSETATCLPTIASTPRSRKLVAPPAASTSKLTSPPPAMASRSTGSSTMNGTTATSWKSSMPSAAVPKRDDIISLSASSCSAKADELSVSPKPTTSASSTLPICRRSSWPGCTKSKTRVPSASPTGRSAAVRPALVSTTCARPKPKAYLARLWRRVRLSSRPISKSRNWIPSSQS